MGRGAGKSCSVTGVKHRRTGKLGGGGGIGGGEGPVMKDGMRNVKQNKLDSGV